MIYMAIVPIPKGHYVNIPENSFSSGDMFRIMAKNLTKLERLHVLYFFLIVFPATGLAADLFQVISLIFKPSSVIMKILKILRVWSYVIQKISPFNASLLMLVLPEEPRIEGMKLLSVLKKEFFLEE